MEAASSQPASQQPASSKLEVSSLQQDRVGGVRGGCARRGGLGVTLNGFGAPAKRLFPSTFGQTAREWCKTTLRIPRKTRGFQQPHTVKYVVLASWTSKTRGIRPICVIEQPPASHQQPASSKLEVSNLQQDRLGGVRGGCARIGGLGVTLMSSGRPVVRFFHRLLATRLESGANRPFE